MIDMKNRSFDFWLLVGALGFFALVNLLFFLLGKLSPNWEGFGIMVAAGLTLAVYSFLYKDNPAFKVVENLYVGVALAYMVSITWFNARKPDLYGPLLVPIFTGGQAQYLLLGPLFLVIKPGNNDRIA